MIWLSPDRVTLGNLALDGVEMVAIDRSASLTAIERGDEGPHVQFVDVPAQRIDVRIVRRVTRSEALGLAPGASVALSMRRAPSASAAGVQRIDATVVVTSIDHSMNASTGALQRITAIAVSSDGATDPIAITPDSGEL